MAGQEVVLVPAATSVTTQFVPVEAPLQAWLAHAAAVPVRAGQDVVLVPAGAVFRTQAPAPLQAWLAHAAAGPVIAVQVAVLVPDGTFIVPQVLETQVVVTQALAPLQVLAVKHCTSS